MTGDQPAGGPGTGHAPGAAAGGHGRLSEAEFRALYERLRAVPGWGPRDRRGALNFLTPDVVAAACREVRLGRPVSLAAPVEVTPGPDNPDPAAHQMTTGGGVPPGATGLAFATDRLAMNIHGDADTHLDALCHVIYDGRLYNGVGAGVIGEDGAAAESV